MLLDTHLLFWYAYYPERLPREAANLMASRDATLLVSWASLWEVAIKTSLGRSTFTARSGPLRRTLLAEGFVILEPTQSHLDQVERLPWHHRDPFDRLLVAQALVEDVKLLTVDKTLAAYGNFVKVV